MRKLALVLLAGLPMLAAVRVADDFPPIVTAKTLYAKNDLRGKDAPPIAFGQILQGKVPSLEGKVLLIDFWATWCGPCRALIPELNEWQKKFKNDLVIVGLSDEQPDVIKKFMEKTKMEYVVATDSNKAMSNAVGVQGIPHVLVITQDGIVRWQGFPPMAEDKLTTEKLGQIIAGNRKLKPRGK